MKFRSLESFRGLAAIAVVLYHSGFVITTKSQFIANSAIFVDFFFILSGFVMAFAYLKRIQEGFSFKRFVLLRIGRLYPLYLFTLLLWLPYVLLKGYAYHFIGLGSIDPFMRDNAYTFLTNLLLINAFGLHDYLSWNPPAWSISVEFYTYIFFFLAVIISSKRFSVAAIRNRVYLKNAIANRGYEASITSITTWYFAASSFLAYTLLYSVSTDSLLNVTDFGILRCIGGFSLGVCLYSLYTKVQFQSGKAVATLLEVSSVAAMIYLVSIGGHGKLIQLLVFSVFALVIFLFAIQSNGLISDVLTRPSLMWLGTLSYSIYMVHVLILDIAGNVWKYVLRMEITRVPRVELEPLELFTTPFAPFINVSLIILIIAISHFTYRFVEVPCRDWMRSWVDIATVHKNQVS